MTLHAKEHDDRQSSNDDSIRDCCSRLNQLARMISVNRHVCKTNTIGVSVVMQIQDNHWRGPKCKTARPILCVIEACRRAGENDIGTLADASTQISSNNIDRWQSIKSHVFAVLLARLRF